jgi:hypothetical protein
MNHPNADNHLKEAAALTRAVEKVMRKFVRLLIGRMSLARLQELIRLVFVQEAEAFLKRERPGKNVAMTKLALLTGLDTRTLGKVKEEMVQLNSIAENESFLKGFLPSFKVLDRWQSDPKFIDKSSGEPKVLEIAGGESSFEFLVSLALTSRGITYKSIMDRLEKNGIVSINMAEKTIRLNAQSEAFIGREKLDMIEIGLASVSSLMSTVEHNVNQADLSEEKLFQRGFWSYKLNISDQKLIRKKLFEYLQSLDERTMKEIAVFEEKEQSTQQFTAGVSMFYFEGED